MEGKLKFYYEQMLDAEKKYKIKIFLTYMSRARKELMRDDYTLRDVSDFFLSLEESLLDSEYKILAGVFYSQTIYLKVPPNRWPYQFEVVADEENKDPLFEKKNIILNRRFV